MKPKSKGQTYLQRWFCIDEETGARFSVRVWFVESAGFMVYQAMRVHGIDGKGGTIFHELEGAQKVGAAYSRLEKNEKLTKHLLRDDLAPPSEQE